ncbi:T9SS type A sorting domain-containing protein [Chryseobacterium sp. Y16C]|uniref:T9SS type A sorting domain-containing protein n=1 Tax=Chryseobacterium sp. Y16C TaxID=2920939 RepID=UPI001F0B613F|nr:T9SS type A sorting domain-containing protein [Chryseobacterium sp. Y16C]UMQ41039.1 T9SS type A sorting domain-containing protein [Chryseobacterium sp. Y16C]
MRIISLENIKLIRLIALFAMFLIPIPGFSSIKNDSLKLMISKEFEYGTGISAKQKNQYSKTLLKDWTKAPNSYVFDPNSSYGGIYIPVKKAYAIWQTNSFLGTSGVPSGNVTADVLWEDVHGLIKANTNYSLEIIGAGEDAKIKIPINKSKEGNAVIAFRVNGVIFWSWHVWVTEDPSNGSTYKSFPGVKRKRNDGTVEVIPDSEWKWMDRNLGAVSNSITGTEWNRNGGLLYQWGRKDPIPPLVMKGGDFYEVSGTIGRIRHRAAKNFDNATNFDNLRQFVLLSNATVNNNIQLSVKNPLSLIYVNKDDNSGPAYYNNNTNLMVNWFGKSSMLTDNKLTELNLWSDNSEGKIITDYNNPDNAAVYKDKSSFDPCPNGWRIPSMLTANLGSASYVDDIRIDFSPFGLQTSLGKDVFESNGYHIIKPSNTNVPSFLQGVKVYPNVGFDFSNVGGMNMGVFPGTGQLAIDSQGGQYTDQHHMGLWTATMARHFDATPAVGARSMFMISDQYQADVPDPSKPNVKGRYWYMPTSAVKTSDANACRCIKDPLYVIDDYDFPTEYFNAPVEYVEGLNNPNTYQIVKSATMATVEIPVSKAFSVQSQLLGNEAILNTTSFNNLKANVLWTTNTSLINTIIITNPSPGSVAGLSNSKIVVNINPNQSGNAVVTLHNGSITNPVYWSWHIWVTDTALNSYIYTTELPDATATNYVNYIPKGDILKTEFMDRNLGATDAFPLVVDPLTPTATELAKIRASTGLQYQWGRKDPIPSFQNADNRSSYNVFLGSVSTNGTVAYTTLTPAVYNDLAGNYIVPYNTYSNASNANVLSTDRPSQKIAKVISYAVGHPLVYMIPSSFAPYNSSVPNYTNGTDWLSTEPNLAADRWGRGGEKSPFDPCPTGWRIPDLTGVAIVSNKDFGISPWYKKDKNVATSYSVINDYLGTRVRNSTSTTIGYMYNNTSYQVGNYPNSGSRGFRSVTANQSAQGTFNVNNFQYPGVWTDALNSNYIGRAVNILFDAASTANRMIAFHDNNDSYFGMNCRCVKMKFDQNGEELGVIPKNQVSAGLGSSPGLATTNVEKKEDELVLYPNPVHNTLFIKGGTDKLYQFQVYNAAGQLVLTGQFKNNQADLSGLSLGVYLVKINNGEMITKIIKR